MHPSPADASTPIISARWLSLAGTCVALITLALGTWVLRDARSDAWRQAEQASSNLVLALEQDIDRSLTIYLLSLEGAAKALDLPGLDQLSPAFRHNVIFDFAVNGPNLGALSIIDAAGHVTEDSFHITLPTVDLSDRDYFQIHRIVQTPGCSSAGRSTAG